MKKMINILLGSALIIAGFVSSLINYKINEVSVEKNLVIEIVQDIKKSKLNVFELGAIQDKLDELNSNKSSLSFLNCFYSVNCNLSNEFVQNKTKIYLNNINDELTQLQIAYKVNLFIFLVGTTTLLLRLRNNKISLEEKSYTLEELRNIIIKPILSEVSSDKSLVISNQLIQRLNKIDSINRIIYTKDGELLIHTDKELNIEWLIKIDSNKYFIKLEGLPKKVA